MASITLKRDPVEAPQLRAFFSAQGFTFKDIPYAFWQAQGLGCSATLYHSGKLLMQGKEAAAWRHKLSGAQPGAGPYAEALAKHPLPAPKAWIGTDETGKGDYFGPLVVSGVCVYPDQLELLAELGVDDSKALSNARVPELARAVEALGWSETIVISPPRYNQMQAQMGTVNKVMAWAHAKVIENLLAGREDRAPCGADFVLVDRFTGEAEMGRALGPLARAVRFEQRPKAEDDPAVAAASVVARAAYLRRLKALSRAYGMTLPGGAGAPTLSAGRAFLERHGRDQLGEVAKLHFRTTQQIGG